ncbi:MAG: phosphatidylglycerophosphatase A [Desulfobacteraceae bacterium]|nr:phosphatidylglycerophosphatase A [Desulfobacteraceae bacterium]
MKGRKRNSTAGALDRAALFFATGFGLGRMPFAPGTWGSLIAIPVYLGASRLPFPAPPLFLFLLIVFSIFTAERAANLIGSGDPPEVVIDEVAGMALALAFAPARVYWIAPAFFLFRAFDILKPFPVNYIDRNIHGGPGIVLDDLVAGAMAGLSLKFLEYILYAR